MARESKAAGSPGKCASCGKGLPKGIKEKMTKCPHCGKALKTDSSAIAEVTLPLPVARAVMRLQEAQQRCESMSTNHGLVVARAGANVCADQLLEALCAEAVAVHHAGSFEGLHPRDRLGRWMEKLDASLRHAVSGAHERRAQRHGRELSTLRGRLPVRNALSSPLRSLSEADVSAALAEVEALMSSALRIQEGVGAGAQFTDALHPRDRLGKFMDKAASAVKPSTGRGVFTPRPGQTHVETHRGFPITVNSAGSYDVTYPHSGEQTKTSFRDLGDARRKIDRIKGDSGDNATPRGHAGTAAAPVTRTKPLEDRSQRPTYHGDLAPAAPAPGEGPSDLGKSSGADWDTDEKYAQFFVENKREGYPVEKLQRSDFQRVMTAHRASMERMAALPKPKKQEGQGGHDARRYGGSAPPESTRHMGYIIKRNQAGTYDVMTPGGEHVSEKFSHYTVEDAKKYIARIDKSHTFLADKPHSAEMKAHIASRTGMSTAKAKRKRESVAAAKASPNVPGKGKRLFDARERERKRAPKRMLREQQVRLLVEAGTVENRDEAHALLDRMGV